MFGKRRRAASNPAQRAPPPSASASLAASKAFIKNAESNGDLSSAAAAAALRTHLTTPTPVGETVTKRMVRRGSHSSSASSSRQPAGPLHRQSSSASMTERSFRAPSPGRASPADINAPPVPPVPKDIAQQQQQGLVHRRTSSLEPTYRGHSPAPRGSGRGLSLDRGGSIGAARGQRPATSHLTQLSEEDDASRSVNFSRPMSPAVAATRQNTAPPANKGWFGSPVVNQEAIQRMSSISRPKTSSGVSSHHAQSSVLDAADRPVRTHQIAQGVQGSRLSSGSMRAKPSGTAVQSQSYLPRQPPRPVDPNSPDAIYDPSTRKFIHKQDAMARHRELHEEPEPAQQYVSQHVDTLQPNRKSDHQMGRGSPSPIHQNARQPQPAPQRREEPVPQLPAVPKTIDPVHPPAIFDTPQLQDAVIEARHSEDFADADANVEPQGQVETIRTLADSGYGTIIGHDDEVDSPTVARNQDNAYPRLSTPANTVRSSDSLRHGHERNVSLSPPRNAHFAPVAIELAGAKHDPLPRSVSPAKSALKASPSVSRRGDSPAASIGRHSAWGASSDVSDTASDDGRRKKKKNVRVSFEEDPVVVAHIHNEAPPQRGLSASRWSPIAEKEDEFEDFMKPRPALPSFGSIREKERRAHDDMAEKVTETVSTSSMSSTKDPYHVSSDTALGNIVTQDLAHKQTMSNDPLPPDVSTVEGSGYVSDSSDDSHTHKLMGTREKTQEPSSPAEPKSPSPPQEAMLSITEQTVDVPNIALQPATPSPYEKPEPKFQSLTLPGGWDVDVESGPTRFAPSASVAQLHSATQADDEGETTDDSSIYSDAYEDLSDGEGGFGSIDALMTKPAAPSSGLIQSQHATKSAMDNSTLKPQHDMAADDSEDSDATATPMQDRNAPSEHWSGVSASLNQAQNAQALTERRSDAVVPVSHKNLASASSAADTPNTTPEHKVTAVEPPRTSTPLATQSAAKPLKSALKKSPAQPALQAEPQNRIKPTVTPREGSAQTHMKRTMRGGPTNTSREEPQMGSTMRTGTRGLVESPSKAQPKMRQSMRSADTSTSPGVGLAASRHSMIPMDTKPRAALQKKNIPPVAAIRQARPQSMPATRPMTAPAATYDSDSDASASSFQRTRKRGSREQAGRYTMRGSMRQEPTPTMRMSVPAPRQVRAISPAGSPSPAMRKSMRSSSPTGEPARSSKFSIRSLSPMGRFRKGAEVYPPLPVQQKPMPSFAREQKPTKQMAMPAKATKTTKAPFKSRIVDSSDEDEDEDDRPSRFQSRFQSRFGDSDSDDLEDYKLPPGLTPVRGIPRKAGEEDGDSTDLEEEVDEETANVVSQSAPATNGMNAAQGAALSTGSLRDSKHAPLPSFEPSSKAKTKRGFFGLGKKKTPQPKIAEPRPATAQPTSAPAEIPMPPTQRNRDKGFPMTPIDEDKEFGDPTPLSPVRSPKLQRRTTPEWPLPPTITIDDRPMSSDGVVPRRPRFAIRKSSTGAVSNVSAPTVDAQGRSVSYGRSGKKKKFQGLRRVFGLND